MQHVPLQSAMCVRYCDSPPILTRGRGGLGKLLNCDLDRCRHQPKLHIVVIS